jgi:hypothetical protein
MEGGFAAATELEGAAAEDPAAGASWLAAAIGARGGAACSVEACRVGRASGGLHAGTHAETHARTQDETDSFAMAISRGTSRHAARS